MGIIRQTSPFNSSISNRFSRQHLLYSIGFAVSDDFYIKVRVFCLVLTTINHVFGQSGGSRWESFQQPLTHATTEDWRTMNRCFRQILASAGIGPSSEPQSLAAILKVLDDTFYYRFNVNCQFLSDPDRWVMNSSVMAGSCSIKILWKLSGRTPANQFSKYDYCLLII